MPANRSRVFACAAVAATLVGAAAATTANADPADTGGRMLAFIVPGQQLYSSGAEFEATYASMRSSLEQRGFETYYIDAPGKAIAADGELIARSVETVADENDYVAVVGHSAGGLSARYYLKHMGGDRFVDSYIAIGTPQYGSPGGCMQGPTEGYDTCMFSNLIPALNDGPDTPGATNYAVVQSSGEWTDGRLDGGQCRVYVDGVAGWGTGGDHIVEIADPNVLARVGDVAEGQCPGSYVDEPVDSITWQDTLFRAFRP